MQKLTIQPLPIKLVAIKWENNEPEIREFVQDDKALKFYDRGLEVWSSETDSWVKCEMFHYIVKTPRGGLFIVSPRELETYYSIVE